MKTPPTDKPKGAYGRHEPLINPAFAKTQTNSDDEWGEIYRLASLVGTDAKHPKENLKAAISKKIVEARIDELKLFDKTGLTLEQIDHIKNRLKQLRSKSNE